MTSDAQPRLTAKRKAFAREFAAHGNAVTAAHAVGLAPGTGHALATNPDMQREIERHRSRMQAKADITAERVLQSLYDVAFGDVNDLVEHRRVACRCCWSANHQFQRTTGEYRRHLNAWERAFEKAMKDDADELPVFDPEGGEGYDGTAAPCETCPECHGEGVSDVHVKDTRDLPPSVRALYDGIKVNTSGGIEIKVRSRDKAVELLGKHLGMFVDKVEHNVAPDLVERLQRGRANAGLA